MTSAASAPSDIASVLDEIAEIAAILGDRAVARAVEAVGAHKGISRLQLRVVGTSGSGRATLVNLLLGADILPVSAVPKAPLGIDLHIGEATAVTRVYPDGDRVAVPPAQLRSLLLGGDEGGAGRVEIEARSDVLALCDLHVETLDRGQSAQSWRDLLASSDYVIFLLDASALLSDEQRRFIREHLAPQVGLERAALLVNRMDLIPEEERASILELVSTFLGPLAGRPAILDLSLRDIARSGRGKETLTTLLDDLLARREPMRAESVRQAAASLIDALADTAARQERLNALEESDVEQARQRIAGQQQWLERRVERTQRRITAWVETLLRETLQRRIEGFGGTLRNRLPEEIRTIEDKSTVRRHLPGYIEAVWADFLRGQMVAMRADLAAEERQVAEMIDADFRELLAGVGQPELEAQWDLPSDGETFNVFVMPRRTKQRAENIARGLAFNGLFMLFVAPPLGVLSLIASQVVQRTWRTDLAEAEARALTASAVAAVRQVEEEVKRRMDEQFIALARQLDEDVAAVYRRGTDALLALLDMRATHSDDLAARQEEIRLIARERLPRLRERLGDGES